MELKSQQYSRESFERIKNRLEKIKQEEKQEEKQKEKRRKYKTFAKRFPSLIHTCGLEQAVSFAESKDFYETNFKDLEEVLKRTNKELREQNNLIDYFRKVELSKYLMLSKEALVVAGWLKKYAEALIEEE